MPLQVLQGPQAAQKGRAKIEMKRCPAGRAVPAAARHWGRPLPINRHVSQSPSVLCRPFNYAFSSDIIIVLRLINLGLVNLVSEYPAEEEEGKCARMCGQMSKVFKARRHHRLSFWISSKGGQSQLQNACIGQDYCSLWCQNV